VVARSSIPADRQLCFRRPLFTAARESANRNGFVPVTILDAQAEDLQRQRRADIGYFGEEHGDRVLRVCGKGIKVVLVPIPPRLTSNR
jgi:hypothetical protein